MIPSVQSPSPLEKPVHLSLQDIPVMKEMISLLTDLDRHEAQCVFLFPEGTDLSSSNLAKSHQCEPLVPISAPP